MDTYIKRSQEDSALAWLNELNKVFGDRLYIELQQHDPQSDIPVRRLVSITKSLNIPYVATQDLYYLTQEDEQLQRTLAAMRLNCKIKDLPVEKKAPDKSYFPRQPGNVAKICLDSTGIG